MISRAAELLILPPAHRASGTVLQRAQEIQQSLLIGRRQQFEVCNDSIGFGTLTGMIEDRPVEVRGTPVMQEKDALANSPQRSCAEFSAIGVALRDTVGQAL